MAEGIYNRYTPKPVYGRGLWANGAMEEIKRMYHLGVAYSLDFEIATKTYHAYKALYNEQDQPMGWKLLEHHETPAPILAALAERKMGLT